jgi:molecular chaperone DnaJ
MLIKDHYKTLGVNTSATAQDIKKAYRALAVRFHPDKNPGNDLAEVQFKEVQEAYAILSNTRKREQYDEERWLSGMGRKTNYREAVTPAWLLGVCRELTRSLADMDTHRISHNALRAYILLILSDPHLGVLRQYNEQETNSAIVDELLKAAEHLPVRYLPEIEERLLTLAGDDPTMIAAINYSLKYRINKAKKEQLLPYVVLLLTLGLCLFMYFYSRLS